MGAIQEDEVGQVGADLDQIGVDITQEGQVGADFNLSAFIAKRRDTKRANAINIQKINRQEKSEKWMKNSQTMREAPVTVVF